MKRYLLVLAVFGTLFVSMFTACTKDIEEIEPIVVDTSTVDTTTTDTTTTDTVATDTCTNYETYIKPIIDANCISCHGSGAGIGDFTSYSGVKQKVDLTNSNSFENRVLVVKDMPQGSQLTQVELDKLQCWIDQGALEF